MSLDLEQDIKGMLPEKQFDRRDFMWSALGASAALALANSASGQQVDHRQREASTPPT